LHMFSAVEIMNSQQTLIPFREAQSSAVWLSLVVSVLDTYSGL
jgi:hypothetical protein